MTDFLLLSATGLFGGSGMLLWAQAYRHAEAALLAPFDYTALLWTTLLGFAIWGEIPGFPTAAGMVVIAASGIFLLRHGRLQRYRPESG